MNIQEDYVSFETVKLLKEKGFNSEEVGCHGGFYSERCYESGYGIITESGKEVGLVYDDLTNCDLDYDEYLRPTLQMAMKWLRKVHNIHIEVRITNHSLSSFIDVPRYYWIIVNAKEVKWMDESTAHKPMSYETVEEACEAAIKYCLENLI